jgi:phosphatidylserine/phosphatidylglycerophosphate/cardiolipin synthase-like enzyme
MAIDITAAANSDDVIVCWRIAAKLPGCLGFALDRQSEGSAPENLHTSMPFDSQPKPTGALNRPSTEWPIQRFVWTDHLAPSDVRVRYRVTPVGGNPDAPPLAAISDPSGWTNWVSCRTGNTAGYSLFPNRGIVAAPWVDRELDQLKAKADPTSSLSQILATAIATTGNDLRERLSGTVLEALRSQFRQAAANGEDLHAALYELRDDELTELLVAAGTRCHLILANGAFNKTDPDPNHAKAALLVAAGVDVQRRMVHSGHFAHNKFVVFGRDDKARVWTGSTNWTPSGLCTQANHALVIDDDALAKGYLAYWDRLHSAGDGYPPELAVADGQPAQAAPSGRIKTRAWLTPVNKFVDLDDARAMIAGAQQGALFLLFRPGNTNTLVDDIMKLHTAGRFIRGVVNTDFLGPNTPATIQFFNKSAQAAHNDPELVLPAHLQSQVGPLDPEIGVQGVLIHSKTIVLDPFGDHPVVITGSHNLGEKASQSNDDNMVIIENAPGIAIEFAVYIMNIYDQYKWRYEKGLRAAAAAAAAATPGAGAPPVAPPAAKPWTGLNRHDTWQNADYLRGAQNEARFWFGP